MSVSKRHIVIISLWFPTKNRPTYGVFVENQAAELAKHYHVTVLLLERSIRSYFIKSERRGFTIVEVGAKILPLRANLLIDMKSRQYLKAFDRINNDSPVDLIHSHSYMSSFSAQHIADKRSIPHVTTIHDTTVLNDTIQSWKKPLLKNVLQKANKVIAVGEVLKKYLDLHYCKNNVILIPNLIDTQVFTLGLRDDNKFKFLYVGSFDRRKGLLEMIEAFDQLDMENKEFHFVGYGEMETAMKALIAKLGIEGSTVFYGRLTNDKTPEIYQSCHAYVSFSELETFGVTVVEAMSCGLPVVFTSCGGPEDTVAAHCGIKVERTVSDLSDGMECMIANYNTFDNKKIRQHAIDNYSNPVIARKLISLYDKIWEYE
ncbi:MAG: glycosyltransferase [Saprospiraceae bacterium]